MGDSRSNFGASASALMLKPITTGATKAATPQASITGVM